ncbi:MAG: DNA repair protein RecN [Thermoleophilia bacterium]
MLTQLRIENLAVIAEARLSLSPGLNVITGETGAGKTILAHAISLLLGARADSGLIRPGADEASVSAVFTVPPGYFADLASELEVPEGEELIVRRRVSRDGRSRAFLDGHPTTLAVLGRITGRLLAFSAQHEQRRLMMASRQLQILDAFAGNGLLDLKEEFGLLFDRRSGIDTRLQLLNESSEAQAREAELLNFQVGEIEAACPVPGEDGLLEAERRKLLAAVQIREAAAALAAVLGGNDAGGGESMMDALSQAMSRLAGTAGVDDELDAISARLESGYLELEEVGRAAREYSEGVADDPVRLAEVQERLELLGQLKRKYGGSLDEVMGYEKSASEKLALFQGDAGERPQLERQLAETGREMSRLALDIRARRLEAAGRLERDTAAHLGDLAFVQCGFEVRVTPFPTVGDEDENLPPEAFTRAGADAVEFFVSPNPGMPASPIRDTASGGELSRIMLAIKSSVSTSHDAATLVFDEIDAGIGGETGAAVGAKLKSIAGNSQVICITHLPQIACCAGALFSVVKQSDGDATATTVSRLAGEEIVDELCRMMGSKPQDARARAHAGSLLADAG